jgi:hypothetical protein
MSIMAFWILTSCERVDGTYCLHLQGGVRSSEMLITMCKTTLHHKPEDIYCDILGFLGGVAYAKQ